jgi:hypothetical protein
MFEPFRVSPAQNQVGGTTPAPSFRSGFLYTYSSVPTVPTLYRVVYIFYINILGMLNVTYNMYVYIEDP